MRGFEPWKQLLYQLSQNHWLPYRLNCYFHIRFTMDM